MAKFHINPATGDAGECGATVGACPFGGADEHYGSAEEARGAYESMMSSQAVVTLEKRTLNKDIYVSVLTSDQDVLTENFAGEISNTLEPGEYVASYYDSKSDKDRYVKLKVGPNGELEYERLNKFRRISSPSSLRTQQAVTDLRENLGELVAKSDPSYCQSKGIDRITLLETSNEIRRMIAKFDWDTAEGATAGRVAFEDLEWVIDHDLTVAEEQGRNEEIKALTESKELVSSFITELHNRRV